MVFFRKVSSQELVDFSKNLLIMLKSGITINEALTFLAEQTKSKVFSKIIYKVRDEVRAGTFFSKALAKQKEIFGEVFISLVKTGEASGTLEENLAFLVEWLERNNDLKKEIDTAMIYPKIVLVATFLLVGMLIILILPHLIPLFETFKIELPLPTKLLLRLSIFIQKSWNLLIIGIVVIFVLFTSIYRIKKIKRFFHSLYLRIPFFGELIIEYQLALMSQLFSTLFRSGISIQESLKIVSGAITNICYQESLKEIEGRIQRGIPLAQAMHKYPKLYPDRFVNIIYVGEKSGTLDNSFVHLTEFYSKEINRRVKRLPSVVEPLLLIFIGLIVGFVALSIIMPIYELTRGFHY